MSRIRNKFSKSILDQIVNGRRSKDSPGKNLKNSLIPTKTSSIKKSNYASIVQNIVQTPVDYDSSMIDKSKFTSFVDSSGVN